MAGMGGGNAPRQGEAIFGSLSTQKYGELRQRYNTATEANIRDRFLVCMLHGRENWPAPKIADFLGLAEPEVTSWLQAYGEGGLEALGRLPQAQTAGGSSR